MKRQWVITESTYLKMIKDHKSVFDSYGNGYDKVLSFREEGIIKDEDAVGLPVDSYGRIPIEAARERFGQDFCKDKPSMFDEDPKSGPNKNNPGATHSTKTMNIVKEPVGSFDLFSNIPTMPLATNSFHSEGLHKVPKSAVLKGEYKEWQFNPDNSFSFIVLDADYNFYDWWVWNNEGKPVPNIVVTNPETMKSHLYFRLGTPVHNNIGSSKRARYMYNRLRKELTVLFEADPNYVNKVAHCPFCKEYCMEILNEIPYTMKQLSVYTKGVIVKDKERSVANTECSRNCTLFNLVRMWAYSAVGAYKSFSTFYDSVAEFVESHNGSQEVAEISGKSMPLSFSETRSIINSVAEYVWSHRGRYVSRRTSERANECRVRGLFTRNKETEKLQRRFLSLFKQGKSFTVIAEALGVARQTIHRWFLVVRCLLHETPDRIHTRASELTHDLFTACSAVLSKQINNSTLTSVGYFDSGG